MAMEEKRRKKKLSFKGLILPEERWWRGKKLNSIQRYSNSKKEVVQGFFFKEIVKKTRLDKKKPFAKSPYPHPSRRSKNLLWKGGVERQSRRRP